MTPKSITTQPTTLI